MGSKARIAKDLLSIILRGRVDAQYYIEPFAGGMNMIQYVSGNRIANDINYYLIEMFKSLVSGWIPPKNISKEFYKECRDLKHPAHITGYVGFNCSYSGKWFGGYAGQCETKDGIRDYQLEAYNNIMIQVPKLYDVIFENKEYFDLCIPDNSIIYCDPPYQNTTCYKDKFEHVKFWNWCRDMKHKGHDVYVSEYEAPSDFICIYTKQMKSSLSANGKSGYNKTSYEKLFTL